MSEDQIMIPDKIKRENISICTLLPWIPRSWFSEKCHEILPSMKDTDNLHHSILHNIEYQMTSVWMHPHGW
jgi:hypothetical protein